MHTIAGTPCRATLVAADFLDFTAFCRCSSGVAPHPLKISVSHLSPPFLGGVAPKFGSEKVSRYTGGVAGTVAGVALHCATKFRIGAWSVLSLFSVVDHVLSDFKRLLCHGPRL